MALVQIITSNTNLIDSPNFAPADRWDGYVCETNNNFIAGFFQGYCLNWDGFNTLGVLNNFSNMPYSGYTTNFAGMDLPPALNTFINSSYSGYTTNFGGEESFANRSLDNVDNDTVIDHPKDQTIFFKLKGFNPSTQSYETWVVSEEITSRPETFDPGRNPPNYMDDVYKTPPSNNNLVNIIIVARWIE